MATASILSRVAVRTASVQPQKLARLGDASAILKHPDCDPFDHERPTRTRLRPGNLYHFRAPIGAAHSRHPRRDDGFKLHGVPMPPLPFLVAVNGQRSLLVRPNRAAPTLNDEGDPLRPHIHLNVLHFSPCFQPKGHREKFFVLHPTDSLKFIPQNHANSRSA